MLLLGKQLSRAPYRKETCHGGVTPISTDRLRLIATCWKSVCVYKLDGGLFADLLPVCVRVNQRWCCHLATIDSFLNHKEVLALLSHEIHLAKLLLGTTFCGLDDLQTLIAVYMVNFLF